MRPIAGCLAIVCLAAASLAAQAAPDPRYVKVAETDAPNATDSPFTGRYEGAQILGQTVKALDELTLPSGPAEGKPYDNKKKFSATTTLEGKVTRTAYVAPLNRSALEVFRNYKNALTKKGFSPVFERAKEECGPSFVVLKYRWNRKETHVRAANYDNIRGHALMKKSGASGDTYVAVYAGLHVGGAHGAYSDVLRDRAGVLVEVVEPEGMETKMVVLKAEEISGDIASEGRAVFYSIQFDFDKADIKPDSAPQLEEMAKALKADLKLSVLIVGHTDNQGKLDYNTALSQRRAEAVVKALSGKYGIDARRMRAKGVASLAPVATNRTEEGRAENRRVEMVEQ